MTDMLTVNAESPHTDRLAAVLTDGSYVWAKTGLIYHTTIPVTDIVTIQGDVVGYSSHDESVMVGCPDVIEVRVDLPGQIRRWECGYNTRRWEAYFDGAWRPAPDELVPRLEEACRIGLEHFGRTWRPVAN